MNEEFDKLIKEASNEEKEVIANHLKKNRLEEVNPLIREDWKKVIDFFITKQNDIGIHECARELAFNNNFLTIPADNDRDTLYLYEEGIYKPIGREFIKKVLESELQNYSKSWILNEVIKKVIRKTIQEKNIFDSEPLNYIPLNNGIYDIETDKLIEFRPSHHFLYKIPIDYNPAAECPLIKGFLEETLYPEDIEVIYEWFGFLLYRNYFIKKGLLIVGEKDTGKSTFINLLKSFIDITNISSVSLQDLANDKFALGRLYNKHLNVYDDLSFSDINDTGTFKVLTGNSIISGQHKFKDAFNFKNYAKLTFTANRIPPLKDKDYQDLAYFSRWILIIFDSVCLEQDNFLIDKITTPSELSGLLNIALKKLSELLKSGKFSYKNTPEQVRDLMKRNFSPIYSFFQDCCIKEPNFWISKEEFYNEYLAYCEKKNLPKMTKERLGRQFPLIASVSETRHKTERGWLGIKVNEKGIQLSESVSEQKEL